MCVCVCVCVCVYVCCPLVFLHLCVCVCVCVFFLFCALLQFLSADNPALQEEVVHFRAVKRETALYELLCALQTRRQREGGGEGEEKRRRGEGEEEEKKRSEGIHTYTHTHTHTCKLCLAPHCCCADANDIAQWVQEDAMSHGEVVSEVEPDYFFELEV